MQTSDQAAAQQADEQLEQNEFEVVKNRLAEIAEAVEDDALSLDEALDLYEEAVSLGLRASDLLETGVPLDDDQAGTDGSSAASDEGEPAQAKPAVESQAE